MNKMSLDFWWKTPKMKRKILKDVIVDRKSKYTVVYNYVENREQLDEFIKILKQDKYFKKATHNSFAYRIKQENGSLLEGKNDDWETGAWMCILREIQRANYVNVVVVVTRFFWWILLQADRFKNVINSVKIIFEQDENN